MKDKFFVDLKGIMDEIFEATEDFKNAFKDGFPGCGPYCFEWDEKVDFYPSYHYPPANIFMTEEKTIIFEFALAGFSEKDVSLEFKGDYLLLSAKAPEERTQKKDNGRYFKKRLKFKDIQEQKYFVPADKFDREQVSAVFSNGMLRVVVPAKEKAATDSEESIKVNIKKEGK